MKHSRLRTALPSVIGLILFIIALFVLRHELHGHPVSEILSSLVQIPLHRLVFAAILVTGAYLFMTFYDTFAFYFIEHHVPYRSIALASFVAHSLANSIGFVPITSGSVRYRFYSAKGVPAAKILHVVAYVADTIWVGFCALSAAVFLIIPPAIPASLNLPFTSARPFGFLLAAFLVVYLFWSSSHSDTFFSLRGHRFRFPRFSLSLLQMTISSSEWLLAASAVYALLPHIPGFTYPQFISMYLFAQFFGMVSQVPGGFGVFESVVLALIPSSLGVTEALASLFVFRVFFNLIPLAIATCILGVNELRMRRHQREETAAG